MREESLGSKISFAKDLHLLDPGGGSSCTETMSTTVDQKCSEPNTTLVGFFPLHFPTSIPLVPLAFGTCNTALGGFGPGLGFAGSQTHQRAAASSQAGRQGHQGRQGPSRAR